MIITVKLTVTVEAVMTISVELVLVMKPRRTYLDLHHRLESRGVSLEGVELTQDGSAVIGTIHVCNECYEKHVAVRHTANDWQTFQDTSAQWMETVDRGAVDRFKFHLEIPDGEFFMEFAVSLNMYLRILSLVNCFHNIQFCHCTKFTCNNSMLLTPPCN